MEIDIIKHAQDEGTMYSALLMIEDALETGVLAKSFLIFNDESIAELMDNIAVIMHEKYGIKVPDEVLNN